MEPPGGGAPGTRGVSVGAFTESVIENALARLAALGYEALQGSDIGAGEGAAERRDTNRGRQWQAIE